MRMKRRYCNTHKALIPTKRGLFCSVQLMKEIAITAVQPSYEYESDVCEASSVFVVPIDDPEDVRLGIKLLGAYIEAELR